MDKAPKLNEAVRITVTLDSIFDAPNTSANIEIPNTAQLVSGSLAFQGDLKKNVPVQFQATLKFTAEGNWMIRAVTKRIVSPDQVWGDAAYIYLYVGKESGHFGFEQASPTLTPSAGVPTPPLVVPTRKQ